MVMFVWLTPVEPGTVAQSLVFELMPEARLLVCTSSRQPV
jgi:hypothetical protein